MGEDVEEAQELAMDATRGADDARRLRPRGVAQIDGGLYLETALRKARVGNTV